MLITCDLGVSSSLNEEAEQGCVAFVGSVEEWLERGKERKGGEEREGKEREGGEMEGERRKRGGRGRVGGYNVSYMNFSTLPYCPSSDVLRIHLSTLGHQQLCQTGLTRLAGIEESCHVMSISGIDLCTLADDETSTIQHLVLQMMWFVRAQHHEGREEV